MKHLVDKINTILVISHMCLTGVPNQSPSSCRIPRPGIKF